MRIIKKEVVSISRDEVITILKKNGWIDTRRGKGSHKVFVEPKTGKVTTIPQRTDLGKGLLSEIRKQTGIDEIR
jgi:predicted RNA binding protein YcfA (HicA-like mRNA interferase family)